jgi:hypothetical protein
MKTSILYSRLQIGPRFEITVLAITRIVIPVDWVHSAT